MLKINNAVCFPIYISQYYISNYPIFPLVNKSLSSLESINDIYLHDLSILVKINCLSWLKKTTNFLSLFAWSCCCCKEKIVCDIHTVYKYIAHHAWSWTIIYSLWTLCTFLDYLSFFLKIRIENNIRYKYIYAVFLASCCRLLCVF